MKTLIVEDDFTSRLLLTELLRPYGAAHVAVNGREAITAVTAALEAKEPYSLICLDIMMPELDGQEALKRIRALEHQHQARRSTILMATALRDKHSVLEAFAECDGYLVKPIEKAKLLESLRLQKLIP